ncbi:MSHA biogenesis protein MshK [Vibrio sp. HA2012]|uniref:MSHA biogenesis protein MshK n=1 Tax=Vibrio sp. HA2012 TaxID=1971595 RepID=UPI001E46F250|nr:MSHA biogenesis protein MshK [Vibrio sp. HA2012]
MVRQWIWVLCLISVTSAVNASQDPTAPLGWVSTGKADSVAAKPAAKKYALPALQSIICSTSDVCSAVLGGQLVSEGESVHGYKVKTITKETVTVVRGGKRWALELFPVDIKHERLQK